MGNCILTEKVNKALLSNLRLLGLGKANIEIEYPTKNHFPDVYHDEFFKNSFITKIYLRE